MPGTEAEYKSITVPADNGELDRVQEFLGAELESAGCDMGPQMQIELAVEEVFVNEASYAYSDGVGQVQVQIRILEDPVRAEIRFRDSGVPYDPLKKEDASLEEEAIMEREGGLGIYLVKEVMDEVEYCREGEENVLTLRKKLQE